MGALLHRVLLPPGSQSVVVNARSSRVFVANSYDGSVSMLDATTGRALHRTTLTYGEGLLTLALDAGTNRLFVMGYQALTMLDATTDNEVLTSGPNKGTFAMVVDERIGRVFTLTGTAGYNGSRVFVVIRNAATGHVVVRSQLAATGAGLLTVDPTTHHTFVLTTNSVRDGFYALSVLDMRTGRTLRTVHSPLGQGFGTDGSVVVDAWLGRLFVADSTGTPSPQSLYVFDSHSGRLLRTLRVGSGYPILALEARAQHLFMTNSAGNTVTIFDASQL